MDGAGCPVWSWARRWDRARRDALSGMELPALFPSLCSLGSASSSTGSAQLKFTLVGFLWLSGTFIPAPRRTFQAEIARSSCFFQHAKQTSAVAFQIPERVFVGVFFSCFVL